jgi:predicted amidophosphoribosyltransferase
MAEELDPSWRFDGVTWVPTTGARRSARGFDQAELLARRLAALVGVRARSCLLRGRGAPQTGAPWAQRRLGPALSARGSLEGKELLVVDDVLTSGATLARAATALRGAGASRIVGLVAAWRPPRTGATPHAPGPIATHNSGQIGSISDK